MTKIRGVAVAGLGETPYYKRGTAPHTEQTLALQAVMAACEDAGIDPHMIDGFASFGHDHNDGTLMAAALGVRELRWSSMVWGSGGGGIAGALAAAAGAIISGQAEYVVVFRALAEGASGRLSAAVSAEAMNSHYRSAGIVAPAQSVAMRMMRLFEHDGVSRSTQQAIAQACYIHARNNPHAAGRETILDDETYEQSRWIAEPFRLFDCSRENDGAGAVLLTSADNASGLRSRSVPLVAVASSKPAGWGDCLDNEDPYASAGFSVLAERLWRTTGLTPDDMDVVQVYENFTGAAVASLIDHGFCTAENAAEVLTVDNLTAPSGRLPINTSGGNVGEGFVHGIGLILEAVRQIRGESTNQVPDARYSMLCGGPCDSLVTSAIFGAHELP